MTAFQTIVGPPAEDNLYFHRPYLDDAFWDALKSGSNLLVAAPRRTGKTSFLKHACNHPAQGYQMKYHITESINQGNEFFKRLYTSLLEELKQKDSIWKTLQGRIKKLEFESVGLKEIRIKRNDLDYFEELKGLLQDVTVEERLVFIVDEFSETLQNIMEDQDHQSAKLFLHQNRELRQDSTISKKMQFVYSGSVGLGNLAELLASSKSINDLQYFEIKALTPKEGHKFIQHFSPEGAAHFPEATRQHLIDQLQWLVPYHIMILLNKLNEVIREQEAEEVTPNHIEEAFAKALAVRHYFEHWYTRLRMAFKGNQYKFAKEVLNTTATTQEGIARNKVYDLAAKYDLEDTYATIVRTLEYDGYLVLNTDRHYVFRASLLQKWWLRDIVI